jgi:hypothetical protein
MDKRVKKSEPEYAEPTTAEKIGEGIFNAIYGAFHGVMGFWRDMHLPETSKQAAAAVLKYDEMVKNGKAEVSKGIEHLDDRGRRVKDVKENIRWFKEMKKVYRKTGTFEDHYFVMVGVFDRKGNPTGEGRVYRIKGPKI